MPDAKEEKQLLARIPKHLHQQVKAQAALTGRPLAEVVEEALREWLAKSQKSREGKDGER